MNRSRLSENLAQYISLGFFSTNRHFYMGCPVKAHHGFSDTIRIWLLILSTSWRHIIVNFSQNRVREKLVLFEVLQG